MNPPTENPESSKKLSKEVKLVKTKELRPEGDVGHCLRPLGLCDLGGCCDVCWYGSDEYKREKRE